MVEFRQCCCRLTSTTATNTARLAGRNGERPVHGLKHICSDVFGRYASPRTVVVLIEGSDHCRNAHVDGVVKMQLSSGTEMG